jgi:putative sigma-54 modulation protein
MRLRISSRNVEIPTSIKGYISDQIEGLTRYFDQILDADVSVTQERHRHSVDVRLHVNGRSYQAGGVGDNLKVPLDEAVEKLRRQLKRHKDKQRRQSLRGDEIVLRGKAVEVTGLVPTMPPLPTVDEIPRKRRATRGPRRRR